NMDFVRWLPTHLSCGKRSRTFGGTTKLTRKPRTDCCRSSSSDSLVKSNSARPPCASSGPQPWRSSAGRGATRFRHCDTARRLSRHPSDTKSRFPSGQCSKYFHQSTPSLHWRQKSLDTPQPQKRSSTHFLTMKFHFKGG